MRARRSWSAEPPAATIPQIPHMAPSLVVALDHAPRRLADHARSRRGERAEVERDRAVGDPLQVVGQLLRHRGLVAAAHLGEAGQARADDEALPVRWQLRRELLEEARPDRARPDEAHVAAEDVPELWQLVELRRAEPAAERRRLPFRAPDELL